MSYTIPSFDPTSAASGQIQTLMGTNTGSLLVANHSGVTLLLTFADGSTAKAWGQTARLFPITLPTQVISWKQDSVLQLSAGYNRVDMEVYGEGEEISGTYPVSLGTPTVQSAVFSTCGSLKFAALATPLQVDTNAVLLNFNIGNYPFSNSEITTGRAVAGTIYAYITGGFANMNPSVLNGTTVEGYEYILFVRVLDSTFANVTSYPDGTDGRIWHSAEFALSGASTPTDVFSSPVPSGRAITVAPGAGPPYYVALFGEALGHAGAMPGVEIVGSYVWAISALAPSQIA